MKKLCLVFGILLTVGTTGVAQDDASLLPLIEKTKSASKSERAAGFETLKEYWKESQEISAEFSDTPIKTTEPKPQQRQITDKNLDRIATALEAGIRDTEADVRKAAAIALVHAPRSSDAVQSAILAGIKSDDSTVNWYVMQQKTKVWPKFELMIDSLIHDLSSSDFSKYYAAERLLRHDAKQTRPYSKRIAEAIFKGEPDKERSSKLYVLCDIEINEGAVETLLSQAGRLTNEESAITAIALLDYPEALKSLSAHHPKLVQALEGHDARLYPFLCEHQDDSHKTWEWLASAESLPANIMAMLREPRFVKDIVKLEANAGSHRKTFLAACKRACGDKADLVIDVDAKHPVKFRPASAWPNSDTRRQSKTSFGHGDGLTRVMVTGEIRGQDGTHPQRVGFYRTNDAMLLGTKQDDAEPVLYDKQTGRFVFLTTVFAAYSMAKDQPEPGPYQTGSAQIRIEAPGCEPLVVQFFDEIPDLRITLEKQK